MGIRHEHRSRPLGGALAALVALSAGCGPSFTPSWKVEELRILALTVDPPEVGPGETATWQALVGLPDGGDQELVYAFIACTPVVSGCLELTEAVIAAGGDEEAGQLAWAATGVRPGLATIEGESLTATGALMKAPTTLLDDAEDPDTGVNAQTTFAVCVAEGCLEEDSPAEEADIAAALGEDAPTGVKRLRISTADAPNHNPVLTSLRFEGASTRGEVEPGGTISLPADEEVTLTAVLAPGSAERYTFSTTTGQVQERQERPYLRWFTSAGELGDGGASAVITAEDGSGEGSIPFIAPADLGPDGVADLHAVVRDRRGGAAWITVHIVSDSSRDVATF